MQPRRLSLWILTALLIPSLGGGAIAAETALTAPIDPTLLEKPIERREGIGTAFRGVSTPSPEAQSFYEQGLALQHSYEWIDAARSFHQALRADPSLAMAHVGLAQTYLQLTMPEKSREHLELATRHAAERSVSDRELAWIEAAKLQLDAVLTPAASRPPELNRYRDALDRLIESDPSDVETLLQRGLAEEPSGWGRGQHGEASALPYFERARALVPNHIGANHYLAHTLENLGRYAEAAEHAQQYAKFAPAVPHAHHMVGHSLPRLGRWEEALQHFESSDGLGDTHHHGEGLPPGADWHHLHNLAILGLVYDEMGRSDDARRTLAEAFETGNPSPSMQISWALYPEFLLARGDAAEAREAAVALRGRDAGLLQVIGTALEGEALLNLGDRAGADAKAEEARRLQRALAERLTTEPMLESLAGLAAEQVAVLDARRALRAGTANPDHVRAAARALASRKTFDAWGRQSLRLERLAQDARAAGDESLAAEIDEQRFALRGPGPVLATVVDPATAEIAPSPAAEAPRGTTPPVAPTATNPATSPAPVQGWNDAAISWREHDAGLAEARRSGKPIVLVFFTEWCPHCHNYQRVFHDPRVVAAAADFVMIRIDRDRAPALSARYAPDGEYIPRTYFLSPAGLLDPEIHAPREQYRYFFDEHDPAQLLRAMETARAKHGARPG